VRWRGVRLAEERKAGCADVYVRRGRKYAHLEVDLIDCRAQGLETLGLVREVAKLIYERVILRSRAWARALQKHPIAGANVIKELLEFILRGEVTHPNGERHYGVPLYFFESPRVWTSASQYRVVVVAEKRIVEDAVAEVERLLEERLKARRGGGCRGVGCGIEG
jgi:hypothetical protein